MGSIENIAIKLSVSNLLNKTKFNFTQVELENGKINFNFKELDKYKKLSRKNFDLRPIKLTGKDAEETLDKVCITANRNAIPYDPQKPRITSGLRLGTPAITTRGFSEEDVYLVGELILRALKNNDDSKLSDIRNDVIDLTSKFPVPGIDY